MYFQKIEDESITSSVSSAESVKLQLCVCVCVCVLTKHINVKDNVIDLAAEDLVLVM